MNDADERALRGFDELPRSANVRLPVVAALFAISKATVWRWCKSGHLPEPCRVNGVTFWNVGELRQRLAARLGGRASPEQHQAIGSDESNPGAPET